jgi:hypothetical protein
MCTQIGLQHEALFFMLKIMNIGRKWNFEGTSWNFWVRIGNMDKKERERGNVHITQRSGAFVQPLLQWKINKYYIFWVWICSLGYPECNAHAPYCHLWPARLYKIFRHYLINGTILEKKLLNVKCVFWFSVQFSSETFFILRITQQDMIINVHTSSCKVGLLVILVGFYWNFNFPDRYTRNIQMSNFMKILPVEAELFHSDR